MINLTFFKSSVQRINTNSKEVVLIGKSNAGKSSFVNSIANNKKLAYVSQKPGKTIVLNYFLVNNKYYIIDTPGYGYQANSHYHHANFQKMMLELLVDNNKLTKIIWIFDIRRKLDEQDNLLIQFLEKHNLLDKLFMVLTKSDKVSNNDINNQIKYLQSSLFITAQDMIAVSNKNKNNISQVCNVITSFFH